MTTAALPVGLSSRGSHLPAALVVAAGTALLVLLPLEYGDAGRLAAVAVLQLVLVVAWRPATGIPGRVGIPVLGLAAAAAADLLLVLPERPEIGALLAVPGLGLLLAVLHQMFRSPRRDVVGSLAGVVLLVCAVTALAVLLLVRPDGAGARPAVTALLVIGATLVAGHLVDLVLPRPEIAPGLARGVPALVISVVAGVAVALVAHGPGGLVEVLAVLIAGLVLAAVAALVGLAAAYALAEGPRRSWAGPLVQAALPVAGCAPVAFALVLLDVL